MSKENIEVVKGVRTPVAVSTENRRRTVEERIFVRFPALVRLSGSLWSRLPPRSRLRRALSARVVRQGSEAANRQDWEFLFARFDPAVEFELPESVVTGLLPPDLLRMRSSASSIVGSAALTISLSPWSA
jgi:hypothetical protein